MKCKHCGRYIADDSVFCEFCGGKVGKKEKSSKLFFAVIIGILAVGILICILAVTVNSSVLPHEPQISSSNADHGKTSKTATPIAQSTDSQNSVNEGCSESTYSGDGSNLGSRKKVNVESDKSHSSGRSNGNRFSNSSESGLVENNESEIGYGTGYRRMVYQISTSVEEEGQVCVEVHVTVDGNVLDARVINSSNHKTTITNRTIQQQCIQKAKQVKYEPGKEELRIIIFGYFK